MNDTTPQVTLQVTEFTDRERSYMVDGGRRKYARSHAYVAIRGESTLQNLAFRHDRPYQAWKPLVEQTLRDNGISFDRLAWSQKAGCACGCSPAFLVIGDSHVSRGHDYWVTLTATEAQVTDEGVERANDRAAQVLADPTLAPLLTSTPEAVVEAAPNGLDRDDHAVPERTYTMADFDTEWS